MSVLRLLPQYAWKWVCVYVYGRAHFYILLFWFSLSKIHQQFITKMAKEPDRIRSEFRFYFIRINKNVLCLPLHWLINKIVHTHWEFANPFFCTTIIRIHRWHIECLLRIILLSHYVLEYVYLSITMIIVMQRHKLCSVHRNIPAIEKSGPRE